MDHNPDRIAVWPGYFDAKSSRRSGRRVPKDSSVLKPDLEGLFVASRALGLRKVKREERVSHPNRPHGKEGRLWVSKKGAKESIGASTKEEILQLIGGQWRQMQKDQRNDEKEAQKRGPKVGDKRARSQRKDTWNATTWLLYTRHELADARRLNENKDAHRRTVPGVG